MNKDPYIWGIFYYDPKDNRVFVPKPRVDFRRLRDITEGIIVITNDAIILEICSYVIHNE